jgi:hypothetical protein
MALAVFGTLSMGRSAASCQSKFQGASRTYSFDFVDFSPDLCENIEGMMIEGEYSVRIPAWYTYSKERAFSLSYISSALEKY